MTATYSCSEANWFDTVLDYIPNATLVRVDEREDACYLTYADIYDDDSLACVAKKVNGHLVNAFIIDKNKVIKARIICND